MVTSFRFTAGSEYSLEVLEEDGARVLCRGWRYAVDGNRKRILAVFPAAENPAPLSLERLAREYELRDELDGSWAVRPLDLVREQGQTMLVLEDPGGEPLDRSLGAPMEVGSFLRIAIGVATALSKVHERGFIHKDIKPTNILIDPATSAVRLTGFGIASRQPRERQAPGPPEEIAGTLAYMAPEQTGRMNRSIDTRSDLYACGVAFYEMLTGTLPFSAADPIEWIHCHIARRPIPPGERVRTIPAPLSAIVMKLLAKTAEARYQTAAGLVSDLRRCQMELEAHGKIAAFRLGMQDASDRLMIPEVLYGREREIDALIASFDRVVASGATGFVLVSGYSGIGKSSVVNELHKVLVPPRGLFASGKFDQYKRDIPYATLAQAFQSLVRPLLGRSEKELGGWRDALRKALGPNGQLIVNLVPELELVIGKQPPAPDLSPQDARNRFQMVFRRFLGVFARKEHPLALFLDDLQWLDAATLDLLEHLVTHPEVRHLLLIGAYRDNEVNASHPLRRTLDAIRAAGAFVQEIRLAPLSSNDFRRLIADALGCARDRADPLARLVHEKTGGNPFFSIQFISALAQEGLLHFDRDAVRWSWEFDRLHARGFTDNVVDLMVGKLARLPIQTQAALQRLACFGDIADIAILSIVLGKSYEDVRSDLWEAVRLELVEPLEGSYRFAHDRVREAAYLPIPECQRAEMHLHIGRLLLARIPAEQREDHIFEIVSQLNRGAALITSRDEREELAELNLLAGQRAKATSAYASALTYLTVGESLLSEDSWERRHGLLFSLEWCRAECEFLTGEMAAASERLTMLSSRAADTVEGAIVACLHMDLFMAMNQADRAVAVCLAYLRHAGIEWSPHPTSVEVRQEYDRIWSWLEGRAIEELIDHPLMKDPATRATLDVLTAAVPPALWSDPNLLSLIICRAVNLSLERGNSDGSCFTYVWLGVLAGSLFGDYKSGFRFGQLGLDLIEKYGFKRVRARALLIFGNLVVPWTKHVRAGRDLLRDAFKAANEAGDLTFAAYSCDQLNTNLLAAGDHLVEVQREAENGLDFARKARFGAIVDVISAQLGLIQTLRGLTLGFGSFDDGEFDELQFVRHLASEPEAMPECRYWIARLQADFFAAHYSSAFDASLKAERLLWTSVSTFETAEYHFYSALCHAALCQSASPAQRQQPHLDALEAHRKQLELWAEHCPENFETRAALVGAEIARIDGRDLDAMRLYEKSVRSARASGFTQNEALANELASRFYATRGFERIAHSYLRDARRGYLHWGAAGKVRQLDRLHPHLAEERSTSSPTSTIVASFEHLDLATVVKVSQAVSSEIVPQKLIDTLMRTAIEHAGAERGLLVLAQESGERIEAEATTRGDAVIVRRPEAPLSADALPESVVQYVIRTRETVILDDASRQNPFSGDAYLGRRHARSILCLPLIKQATLVGVLYLENNLMPGVFTATRVAVLQLLASQAAISLENTRLYIDLEEREAKIRRLVDANIVGIVLWNSKGEITEANQAFLQMVQYRSEDLELGRVRWTDLTPPEWRERDEWAIAAIRATGTVRPFEKEFFRRNGDRVPVLVGVAAFDGRRDAGVAFVVDLTDRKRAEAVAHENERRYREIQLELEHANRVATVGQLSASIAHEVNQPIAAAIINAQAALRWLGAKPPNLDEVQQALDRIVDSGNRACEVIDGIHALIKRAPPQSARLEMNETILDVIALTRGELQKNGVLVRTHFAEDLGPVQGNRIQLQQVLLNLIINATEAMKTASGGTRELLITTGDAKSEGILVAVADSGPGFAAGDADRLFEAFYTTKAGGLGMGLPICRSIVEGLGGRLWASANVPSGAVFQFTIPGAESQHSSSCPAAVK
ncbi:MAG TPA: AAA family ATPase [Acetobacteraceae bacterium]|nr:AAA family ATPase [Acetobacteraceae bacterium]